MTAPTAADLDAADPLAPYRRHFAGDEDGVVAYLDGNSLGRPVLGVADDLARFVHQDWGNRLIRRWDEEWLAEPMRVGDRLGEVCLGAAPGQVVIADSTSVLLYKLVRAAADLDPERRILVTDRTNFPTDRFVVDGVAAERGLRVRWLATGSDRIRPADLEPVLGPDTALVVLSHVAYRSGFLADAATITAQAHAAGALVLWDLSHSVASVPVDLDDWGADLAVGCTYKYLNGGPGSPAFAYVRAGLQDRLSQPLTGWIGAEDPFAMTEDFRPAAGIRRFVTGTPPILAMRPMTRMLELVASAGMPAIRAKSVALTEFAVALTDDRLAPLGVRLASPRDPAERGSHLTIEHPLFRPAVARLWERGVIPDFREPDGLRLGLSPLSTTFAEVERGVDAIREVLGELG